MAPDPSWMATVRDGRLVLDVETALPNGTEVQLTRPPSPQPPVLRCDVLLFVTTQAEREALKQVATRMGLTTTDLSGRFSNYIDLGQVGLQYRVFAVETEIGALQVGGSATKGLLCPVETGARYVIAVGMAFGIDRDTQNFGDVIVSTHVLPYDSVLVDTESDGRLPRIRFDKVKPTSTNPALIGLLRRYYEQTPPNFKVYFGAMLSGSAHIRCRVYRDHLVAKINKKLTDLDKQAQKKGGSLVERVVGGEMEGVGLIATPPMEGVASWLIVKGISDFADEDHGNDSSPHRAQACENAIELVLKTLASAPLPKAQDRIEIQVKES